MEKIQIERYTDDPHALGCIRPESDRWQVVIDKEGWPHFYVATKVELDDEQTVDGMICLEDLLPEHLSVKDIAEGTFGDWLTPEEEAELAKECAGRDAARTLPCPRPTGNREKIPPPRA